MFTASINRRLSVFHAVIAAGRAFRASPRLYVQEFWPSIIFHLYVWTALAALFLGSKVSLRLAAIIGFSALMLQILRPHIRSLWLLKLFLVTLIGFLASSLYYAKFDWGFAAMILANFGIALLLLQRDITVLPALITFYAFVVFISLFALFGGNPNEVLEGASRNSVSVVAIFLCVMVYVLQIKVGQKTGILPSFLILLISIWAVGRSGILASGLLFAGMTICTTKFKIRSLPGLVALVFFSCLSLLVAAVFFDLSKVISTIFYKFSVRGLVDPYRWEIARHYFNKLNVEQIFFGNYLRFDPYMITKWRSNPHNSFIHLHSLIGVGAFAYLFLTIGAILNGILQRDIRILFVGVILLRATTDTFLFFGLFDFIVLYAIAVLMPAPRKLQIAGQYSGRQNLTRFA